MKILGVLGILAGGAILLGAKSAIHEIEAFLLFLIGAVFFSGAYIVAAVDRVGVAVQRNTSVSAGG